MGEIMTVPPIDLLSAFGESILLLDRSRCIVNATGDTNSLFGCASADLIGTQWSRLIEASDCCDSLYWAVEGVFEEWIAPQFIPSQLPFKNGIMVQPQVLKGAYLALRIKPDLTPAVDALVGGDLRPALTSILGFSNVILMGISGPLTDIQLEDMSVIQRDAQFAFNLVEDMRNQWVVPSLNGPLPALAKNLLQLTTDDLPQRRFVSQGIAIQFSLPPNVVVYSNGAIRTAVIDLLKSLPQYAKKQSAIRVEAVPVGDVLEVRVTYRAADHGMMTAQRIDPVGFPERRTIKNQARLKTIVASLHARLSPYGCTAWALPMESLSLATIVMTVPLWRGPLQRP